MSKYPFGQYKSFKPGKYQYVGWRGHKREAKWFADSYRKVGKLVRVHPELKGYSIWVK